MKTTALIAATAVAACFVASAAAVTYPVVDTGQTLCYGADTPITAPLEGAAFHGQDAQYDGNLPSYTDNGDGTVTDDVTGLMWQQDPGAKMTLADAEALIGTFDLAGYTDWRIPTIKELYSLIRFDGIDPSGLEGDDTSGLTPFIDAVFTFEYGDPDAGERIIDSQYLTSTIYVSTTMGGDPTVFGVNFADGRIKGYPIDDPMSGSGKLFFAMFVRGGDGYGVNNFTDNGDGTITDAATGLMWQQADSGTGMTWQDALAYAEGLDVAGHTDWRLPNVKELQSILDYTRSPATDGTPAVDPVFSSSSITVEDGSSDFPFCWSGTSHANYLGGSAGAYVAFGTGYGWMQAPFPPYDYTFMDVHGAGCQRSDPKTGDAADYPYGHGPQGDVIRITNYVRCVRDAPTNVGVEDDDETPAPAVGLRLRAAPNPFNPAVAITVAVDAPGSVDVSIYDVQGRLVTNLLHGDLPVGEHVLTWNGTGTGGERAPSGVYLVRATSAGGRSSLKIMMSK